MLAEAAMKGCYENLFESDLTAALDIESNLYDGIISAGTFTHGHVGPDAFDEILRIAKPGAVFAITINAEHFEANGFAAKLAALSDQIKSLILHKTPIYAESRTVEHAKDEALFAVFLKT
jgi:SAM-dependent methyltransferase